MDTSIHQGFNQHTPIVCTLPAENLCQLIRPRLFYLVSSCQGPSLYAIFFNTFEEPQRWTSHVRQVVPPEILRKPLVQHRSATVAASARGLVHLVRRLAQLAEGEALGTAPSPGILLVNELSDLKVM